MQNKGFVTLFAVLLGLVCCFYLSFNVVTSIYNNKAEEYANGDKMAEFHYLDSMANEKVWLGYTLKECRENELNLGLDLKGGMNVILEVSVPDIVRTLSGNSKDETFNKAMELAIARQSESQKDFIVLFQEAYEELDANARLSAIFGTTFDLKDKISLQSTNNEVIEVLKEEIQAAVDNSFNVLRTRIDRFGVVQPNIQRLETNGRILIELPGVKEPERVRKLLQGSASLEFWETYNVNEIFTYLEEANNAIIAMNTPAEADSLQAANVESLFSKLQVQNAAGPRVGYVSTIDTATVMNYLNLRPVKEILPRDLKFLWSVKPVDEKGIYYELIAIKVTDRDGKAPLGGTVISDARENLDQFSANYTVSMSMTPEGAKIWARLTKENIGRSIAVVLDDMVYSYPTVNTEITGGQSEISGNFTAQEAKDLANVLKSGKMPAPSRIIQEDVVGPSLGQEAIEKGLWSFAIAFFCIMLYMIFFYGGIPGLIVDGALLINVFFLVGILASFKSVLTLPGIAGIVLTMGMAVDANVLIYERIKEELRAGKSHKAAIADGYKNAMSAIIDSNLTTVLTGIILFYFGTGPIKGFATTLIIGIITSFFTAVFVTRLVYDSMSESGRINKLTFTTKLSKNLLTNVKVNWLNLRKTSYIAASIMVVVAIASLSTIGLNQGIDFTGGRNYVVRFNENVNTEEIEAHLQDGFKDASVSVITIGTDNQVRISTNYKINDDNKAVDDEIESILYTELQELFANQGVTKEMFVNGYVLNEGKASLAIDDDAQTFGIQSSQKVSAAIADDIKLDASIAILLSILGICLYILARFRNISYSTGALFALVHDVIFIIGAYSLLYKIMPFSMEIDQSFIAAILTIVGYSINDKVVVFDRVREMVNLYPKRDKAEVINEAVNATLIRTLSTSLSTALVLVVILLLGGETIRGFVFAMLLGVIIGTYSTIFVAVPSAYDFIKKGEAKKLKPAKK